MKQVETIIWMPYPENKPDPNAMDRYHLLYNNQPYVDWWMLSNGGHWEKTSKLDNDLITHIAKCPPVYPGAKTFNFQTALELMKEGVSCISPNKNVFKIINDKLFIKDMDCWFEVDGQWGLVLAEILGKWRLAE